jgi:DDE superfamily endonuclease
VATGEVIGQCGDTRTETDFANFIAELVNRHPDDETYHFVADQLNTHQSKAWVRLVAGICDHREDLGITYINGSLTQNDFFHAVI